MRLTTKGRYAVTAMLDLAMNAKHGPVSLVDISERQKISVSYLEQLFAKLRRAGLVLSVRGPGGGYRLGREDDLIFISEVIDAVDEVVDATRCQGQGNCQEGETCLTHELWEDLSEQIHQFLSKISLGVLMRRQGVQQIAARQSAKLQKPEVRAGYRGYITAKQIDVDEDSDATHY
jgi:Rrf2 family transcriptional regulator, iron-sulfur cluster assembly transcription factor